MKNILLLTLVLAAYGSVSAHSHKAAAKEVEVSKTAVKPIDKNATAPASAAATDDSANYVGTNDFYLALVREGIRKA